MRALRLQFPGLGRRKPLPSDPGKPGLEVPRRSERIAIVDVARGLALVGMIVFHLARDLEMFEIFPPGTTLDGFWFYFARLIAGTFMLLVGTSLVLAHGDGIRWAVFGKRAAIILVAALAVSITTYLILPERFVYFGILHAILLASIAGVILVRAPAWVSLMASLGVLAVWLACGRSLPLDPWLGWTGLAAAPRPTLDLVPVFPWVAFMYLGIALARMVRLGPSMRLLGRGEKALAWLGRHSLAVYLLHQPLLVGTIWSIAGIAGAT